MGLRRADVVGASVGQPDRVDQHSEAYQARLRAGAKLEIPQAGIDRMNGQQLGRQPDHNRNAYLEQEQAARARGEAWQTGQLATWQKFQNGRGRRQDPTQQLTSGAVVIDQPTSARVKNPTPRTPTPLPETERPDGWTAMRIAHQRAARFEEHAREELAPFIGRKPKKRRGVVVDR